MLKSQQTKLILVTLIVGLFGSPGAHAIRGSYGGSSGGGGLGGQYAFGIHLGLVNSAQNQLNDLIKRANSREGGISTSELTSA